MIKQCASTNINSRSECDPYDSTGFLPLIVSPMYCCVDKHNASIFLSNKIKVCMPRKEYMDDSYQHCSDENYFDSFSLDEFVNLFINTTEGFLTNNESQILKTSVCIDTAAGHLVSLHEAIKKAKKIHGNNLIIMAGNVGSIEAFVELAKTGCDYIRVGIGGGGGCNTTSNTGVGQENLFNLIKDCSNTRDTIRKHYAEFDFSYGIQFNRVKFVRYNIDLRKEDIDPVANVKIVADGISSYINYCQKEYNFNDNGYAAINKLLDAGADLVMVGKLFAQCVESAGQKGCSFGKDRIEICEPKNIKQQFNFKNLYVKYAGMSTQQEQERYKPVTKMSENKNSRSLKPSEGSVQWIPVRWSLDEWLNGSDKQDESPYLMGFINSLKSMMSYTGKAKL